MLCIITIKSLVACVCIIAFRYRLELLPRCSCSVMILTLCDTRYRSQWYLYHEWVGLFICSMRMPSISVSFSMCITVIFVLDIDGFIAMILMWYRWLYWYSCCMILQHLTNNVQKLVRLYILTLLLWYSCSTLRTVQTSMALFLWYSCYMIHIWSISISYSISIMVNIRYIKN